ncbi:MAG: serine/threonine-protein kinase [Chloroflexota bacterium]
MTPIPRHIGRYRIVRIIGEGGMGRVLLAEDPQTETRVAIKHIHLSLLGTSNYHRRFEREMEIMTNLNHPNLMPLLDHGEFRGLPYYVMPYIDGVSVRDYTTMYGAFKPEQALPVVDGVCSALIYMHSHSVYHRDIKPHNILIARDGVPYLTDFGIAAIENAPEQLTNTVQRAGLGTDGYIAPELRGGAFASPRTDVYSLGMTIYEMFARRSLYKVLSEDVSNPMAPIPEPLQPVLRRAIDQTPKFRQQTVNEFRREFRRAVKQDMAERVPSALQQNTPPVVPEFRLPDSLVRTEPTNRTGPGNTGVSAVPPPILTGARRQENYIVAVMVTIVSVMVVGTIYFGARGALNNTQQIAGEPTVTATDVPTTQSPTATHTSTTTPTPTSTPSPTVVTVTVDPLELTGTFEAAFFNAITATSGAAYGQQTLEAVVTSTSVALTRTARAQITPTVTPRVQTVLPTTRPTRTTMPTATPAGIPFAGQELFVQRATGLFSRVGDTVNVVLQPGAEVIVIEDTFGNTFFDLGTDRYIVVQAPQGTGWVRDTDLGRAAPPTALPAATADPITISVENPDNPAPTSVPQAGTGVVIGVGMTVNIVQETYAVNLPGSTIGVEQLSPGMQVTVLEGPRSVDELTWWRIRTSVSDGWVTAAVISPAP